MDNRLNSKLTRLRRLLPGVETSREAGTTARKRGSVESADFRGSKRSNRLKRSSG
jgi:hypothetical protein